METKAKFQSNASQNSINKDHPIRAFVYNDYSIEPHNHDFYEMNIILSGKGVHEIENAVFNIEAGDVFVIPPLTVHAYYDTENLSVQHIIIEKDFIDKIDYLINNADKRKEFEKNNDKTDKVL